MNKLRKQVESAQAIWMKHGQIKFQNHSQHQQIFTTLGLKQPTLDDFQNRYINITQGLFLLLSATEWLNPIVGGRQKSKINTSKNRGIQWRFCLAFSGYESCIDGLTGEKKFARWKALRGIDTSISTPIILPPPRLKSGKQSTSLSQYLQDNGRVSYSRFLKIAGDDMLRAFDSWVIEGKEISSHKELQLICASLRNLTSHGNISASRAEKFRMLDAYDILLEYMVQNSFDYIQLFK